MSDLRERAREMAVRTGANPDAFIYEFHRDGYARECMAVGLEWAADATARRWSDLAGTNRYNEQYDEGRLAALYVSEQLLRAEAARLRAS